jgi:hypothetical protein
MRLRVTMREVLKSEIKQNKKFKRKKILEYTTQNKIMYLLNLRSMVSDSY